MVWDGKERRDDSLAQEMRDLVIETNANVKNLIGSFDDHRETFKEHVRNDSDSDEKMNNKIDRNTWYLAIGMGILIGIEFFKDKIFK